MLRFHPSKSCSRRLPTRFVTWPTIPLHRAVSFGLHFRADKRLHQIVASRDLPWDRMHFYWGDERNVPHDHSDSNFLMARETLLDSAPIPEANIHPVPVTPDDPAAGARQYEDLMRQHFEGQSFPAFDLVLLGMGDDAHTASLFPHTTALQECERWFVENQVEKLDTFRYTMTAPAINAAREIWFLVAGEGKREALRHVLSNEDDPSSYPSQLIHPTRWFVTSDAMPSDVD